MITVDDGKLTISSNPYKRVSPIDTTSARPYSILNFRVAIPKLEEGMKKAELKSFGEPDEVREFPKGRLELIKIGGQRGPCHLEPGWRWANSVQPIARTKSCEAPHFQYHISGVLKILMDDGTEFECRPGDVSFLPSGHDAWVVGDQPVIIVDFQGMIDYARYR